MLDFSCILDTTFRIRMRLCFLTLGDSGGGEAGIGVGLSEKSWTDLR